jgi:hypothetical protein
LQLIELLLGGLIAGIDLESAIELGRGTVQIAALDEDASLVDVSGGGLEARAVKVSFVTKIVRLQIGCVPVVLKGGVEVVMRFGGLSALVPGFGRLGVRGGSAKDGEAAQKQES